MTKTEFLRWVESCLLLACLLAACATQPATPAAPPAPLTPSPTSVTTSPSPTPNPQPPTPNLQPSTFNLQPTAPTPSHTPTIPPSPTPSPQPPTPNPLRFAVIGDYGLAGEAERDVANLVLSWSPEFIVTTGDNNYPRGSAATIDQNIGRYYHDYIYPYQGEYESAADRNRFFPSLGNHDWLSPAAQPYLDYFTLPGNERYYDVEWWPVHLFIVDADSHEPDGVNRNSVQAVWLQESLAAADTPWKLVVMHQPPYSSGRHGSTDWMQWPYQEWGATAVLSGHDHVYERIVMDGFPYFVNGLGGASRYRFDEKEIVPGSEARYRDDYGAMLVAATEEWIAFQFITRRGEVVDTYEIP